MAGIYSDCSTREINNNNRVNIGAVKRHQRGVRPVGQLGPGASGRHPRYVADRSVTAGVAATTLVFG